MNPFKGQIKKLIENKDLVGLNKLLTKKPELANEGITIPFDRFCLTKAHPLHRICDPVFTKKISDLEAVGMAKIFLAHESFIDGEKDQNEGTPLLAAASLSAEQTGILYVENEADIHYTYRNNGVTPLHWAAFCGLDLLVGKLMEKGAQIDASDNEHQSTPLGWALHQMRSNNTASKHHQVKCIKLLLKAGADPDKLGKESAIFLKSLEFNK